jgi:hypothetical protein
MYSSFFVCRSNENRLIPIEKKFCVELTEESGSKTSAHFRDSEIFGPGFLATLPPTARLRPGIASVTSGRVSDPDPDSIRPVDPDPDPGGQK